MGTVTEMSIASNRSDAERTFGVASTDVGAPVSLLLAEEDEDGVANIEVWPLPDGLSDYTVTAPLGEYRVVSPYWRYLPDLVADADSNWFTSLAPKWIVDKATAEAFALNWDEERAVLWEQKAAGRKAEAINLDKRRQLGGTTVLPYYRGTRNTSSRRV